MGESPKLPHNQNAFPFAIRPVGGFSYVIMPLTLQEAANTLDATLRGLKGKRVVVLGHMRPDGDCIGSQTALCRILLALGADARCANRHPVPTNLAAYAEGLTFVTETGFTSRPDEVAVAVDCADLSRIGASLTDLYPAGLEANIDHHVSNNGFAKVNVVVEDAAATCHVLAYTALQKNLPVDAATAASLYLGLVTDTGSFRFRSTSPEVLEVAATLIRKGASPSLTTERVFESESPTKFVLIQRFLASMRLVENGRIAIGEIPIGLYEETGTSKEDKEGLVDFPRSIAGVDIAVLMEEAKDGIKGSLRGKNPELRLDLLAAKLNGGGHKLAAGFNCLGASFAKDRERIEAMIVAHLRERAPR